MMSRRQARVGGRLAGALEALMVAELREHQRSSRLADARDRFQKVSVPCEGVGASDVLVDPIFEPVDLFVDALENRLKRVGDRRVLRLADLVVQAVALFFELVKAF